LISSLRLPLAVVPRLCVVAGDQDIALINRIEAVLFPRDGEVKAALTASEPEADQAAIEGKWRNEALDIHALWCHIHYGGDVFVTSDRNFFKATKQQPLAELGAPRILRPCDALRAATIPTGVISQPIVVPVACPSDRSMPVTHG
jgi:hypothetical protein